MAKTWHKKYGVYIKNNSHLARMAAWKLNAKEMAMVIGKTIHLYGVTQDAFLKNERWLKHELKHVQQYEENGIIKFWGLYLLESVKNGYYNNKFEKEARAAEDL
ncbi:eCIS core domain-containing protein [Polluticaenibacter yanchengensis]|uniref:DUF4157 domain-containing protein n=1 Tax=Polluticaenibacter yanchengensis TaxID=3014562 RepID=A0ABT4UKL9_9BACT|nr:DUF4157 domain-containing protein [Chitinophagaceae bacterium LY-5]